jgi:hypothetical protein
MQCNCISLRRIPTALLATWFQATILLCLFFAPEDQGMFLRNVGRRSSAYKAIYPRIYCSIFIVHDNLLGRDQETYFNRIFTGWRVLSDGLQCRVALLSSACFHAGFLLASSISKKNPVCSSETYEGFHVTTRHYMSDERRLRLC